MDLMLSEIDCLSAAGVKSLQIDFDPTVETNNGLLAERKDALRFLKCNACPVCVSNVARSGLKTPVWSFKQQQHCGHSERPLHYPAAIMCVLIQHCCRGGSCGCSSTHHPASVHTSSQLQIKKKEENDAEKRREVHQCSSAALR